MTPLEKVNSMRMPFAELKGVTFTEADKDRVVARMLVRADLCTLNHTIHGGALMALADSVGAAATVINLPEDAKGTTTIESKTNFIGAAREGTTITATATPVHRGRRGSGARSRGYRRSSRPTFQKSWRWSRIWCSLSPICRPTSSPT